MDEASTDARANSRKMTYQTWNDERSQGESERCESGERELGIREEAEGRETSELERRRLSPFPSPWVVENPEEGTDSMDRQYGM